MPPWRQLAWNEAWRALGGAAADESRYAELIAAWSEPHRRYHTLQHLDECLALFERVRPLAQAPGEVALALFFHDAHYDPRRHDNEERSACWARASIVQAGAAAAVADRVQALVLATRHDAVPAGADAQLLVDIDLAILGAEPQRFDEYERQVRLEYAHVPEPDYRAGRTHILRRFLARPRIYSTAPLAAWFEAAARQNLARALARLAGPS